MPRYGIPPYHTQSELRLSEEAAAEEVFQCFIHAIVKQINLRNHIIILTVYVRLYVHDRFHVSTSSIEYPLLIE